MGGERGHGPAITRSGSRRVRRSFEVVSSPQIEKASANLFVHSSALPLRVKETKWNASSTMGSLDASTGAVFFSNTSFISPSDMFVGSSSPGTARGRSSPHGAGQFALHTHNVERYLPS